MNEWDQYTKKILEEIRVVGYKSLPDSYEKFALKIGENDYEINRIGNYNETYILVMNGTNTSFYGLMLAAKKDLSKESLKNLSWRALSAAYSNELDNQLTQHLERFRKCALESELNRLIKIEKPVVECIRDNRIEAKLRLNVGGTVTDVKAKLRPYKNGWRVSFYSLAKGRTVPENDQFTKFFNGIAAKQNGPNIGIDKKNIFNQLLADMIFQQVQKSKSYQLRSKFVVSQS